MKYRYKAKDKTGGYVEGNADAMDAKNAAIFVREKGLTLISLSEDKKMFDPGSIVGKYMSANISDLANFTRQLATMINAGLPLTDALSLLKIQSPPALALVLEKILMDVQSGLSLSESISKHPRIFNRVYVALIRAGESAGVLEKILARLADSQEKSRDFLSKVRNALIYPIIVLIGMVGVMVVMMTVVVPKLTAIYNEFGATLPFMTQLVIGVSNFMVNYWWILVPMVVGGFFLFRSYVKVPAGRRKVDRLMYDLPIIGPLAKMSMITEVTRTLSLLIGAGVSIVESINIVAAATGNLLTEESMHKIAKQVEKGFPLSVSFSEAEVFPVLVGQMIAVGEETGKLDEILSRLSSYYENETDGLVKGLTTAIEPLIIVLLGVGVGFLIFAVIMPIYNLTSQF